MVGPFQLKDVATEKITVFSLPTMKQIMLEKESVISKVNTLITSATLSELIAGTKRSR